MYHITIAMGGLKLTTATNMVSNFKNPTMGHFKRKTFIAVDNDPAGIQFAEGFPVEIPHEIITPEHKDWNEDLITLT